MAKHKTAEHVLGEEEARKLKPDQDGVVNIENGVTEIGFRAFRNRKDVKKNPHPEKCKDNRGRGVQGVGAGRHIGNIGNGGRSKKRCVPGV